MIGRKAAIGLSMFCALALNAFVAQGAWAVEGPANATAFTCVASGGETNKDFKDAHCDENVAAGTGSFEHLKIANNVKTGLAATNEKVTENTTKPENAVLTGTLAKLAVTITCTKVKNNTAKSFVENTEPAKGTMRVKGTAVTEFGGEKSCTVSVKACNVTEPIISEASFEGVTGLEGPKGEKNAMGVKFTGVGAEETFAVVTFGGGLECPLNGQSFKVKGSVIATSGPGTEAAQENKWSGATQVFTPKFNMEKLKFGPETAEFSTIVTPTMSEGGNPISGTTAE